MRRLGTPAAAYALPLAVAAAALTYVVLFFDMPISEDAAFYGFVSKSMYYGSVLHRDVPVATNSLALYLVAGLFKLTGGPSLVVYRFFYGAAFVGFALAMYVWCAGFCGRGPACAASILAVTLLPIPHLMLDLGRNQIVVSLLLTMIALRCMQLRHRAAPFAAGTCLALACITRETFIVPSLIVAAYYCSIYWRATRFRPFWYDAGAVAAGFGAVFALDGASLLSTGTLHGYVVDMGAGGAGRYADGFLSLARLHVNVSQLAFGWEHYYGAIVLFSMLAYAIPSPCPDMRLLKYCLIPAYLLEALVINTTQTYSIQPTLAFCGVLLVWTLWRGAVLVRDSQRSAGLVVPLLVASFCLPDLRATADQYRSYRDVIALHAPEEFDPYRMLRVTEALPFKTAAAWSQYPLLFLTSKPLALRYPLLADLTAPLNLGLPSVRAAALESLRDHPADLFVDKTAGLFTATSDQSRIVDPRYVTIAYLDFPKRWPVIAPYRSRLRLSKAFLSSAFFTGPSSVKTIADGEVVRAPADVGVLAIDATPASCMASLEVVNGELLGVPDPSAAAASIHIFHRSGDPLTFRNPACKSARYTWRERKLRAA